MDHILKALNDALENKEYQIKWLNEEIEKLRKERDELQETNDARMAFIKELESEFKALQTENKSLKNDLSFYSPPTEIPTVAAKEEF
jgi:uncharacterized coiled-coil DUF342 family protein